MAYLSSFIRCAGSGFDKPASAQQASIPAMLRANTVVVGGRATGKSSAALVAAAQLLAPSSQQLQVCFACLLL